MEIKELIKLLKSEDENIRISSRNDLYNEMISDIEEIVNKYEGQGVSNDDLFQEASYAFLSICDEYKDSDVDFSYLFETEIADHLESIIDREREYKKENEALANRLNAIIDAEIELKESLKRNPSHKEIAEKLGISNEEFHELREYAVEILKMQDEELKVSHDDLISDLIAKISNSLEEYEDDMSEEIEDDLDLLDENEKNIITLLFGLNGDSPKTEKEVALMYGVSEARIRQIKDLAIRKMKESKN